MMPIRLNGKCIIENGQPTNKETEMATLTPDKISRNCGAPESPAAQQDSKLHAGPVARLLARVSRWSSEYADYQMENGSWRKLAI